MSGCCHVNDMLALLDGMALRLVPRTLPVAHRRRLRAKHPSHIIVRKLGLEASVLQGFESCAEAIAASISSLLSHRGRLLPVSQLLMH